MPKKLDKERGPELIVYGCHLLVEQDVIFVISSATVRDCAIKETRSHLCRRPDHRTRRHAGDDAVEANVARLRAGRDDGVVAVERDGEDGSRVAAVRLLQLVELHVPDVDEAADAAAEHEARRRVERHARTALL